MPANCNCSTCSSRHLGGSAITTALRELQPEAFELSTPETAFPHELYEFAWAGEARPELEFSQEVPGRLSLPPLDTRPFGGNAQLQTDANNLAQQYATHKREPVAKFVSWLTEDYRQTIEGARLRFGGNWLKQMKQRSDPAAQRSYYDAQIAKSSQAWLVSRREQLGFATANYPAHIAFNRPALPPAPRVATPLVDGSDIAPVTATVIRFVEELQKRHRGFSASTYRGHGGGAFNEKGYSIDLFLRSPLDGRGFYQSRDAIAFLQAVNEAAKAANVEWRMIYNDFRVADAVNRALNKRHVIFVGGVRTDRGQVKGLNWHGPAPLILHFHLDLIPGRAATNAPILPASAATQPPRPQQAPQNQSRSTLGTLVKTVPGQAPFSYRFTPEDLLWTARFIVGEAGGRNDADNQAVIWTMFNRYALFTHRVFPTFHQFIRAYSTPLQPILKSSGAAKRHMNDPSFVRTGGVYDGTTIPRGQLRRHLELQNTAWDRLPQSARALAESALRGQIANPIGNASEFASTRIYFRDRNKRWPANAAEWQSFTERFAQSKKWAWVGPIPTLNQQKNAFFIDQRVRLLPPGSVRII